MKGLIIMEYREYRMVGSCDRCRKQSSIGNRLCNKCFWILIGRKKIWVN
ncbi:hypothetical protein [Spiroplasma endosymbiont of Danaus chrysippus]|nr:hypothetical protein [Spiroplasma endosymbiont of Danaus chrysippus]